MYCWELDTPNSDCSLLVLCNAHKKLCHVCLQCIIYNAISFVPVLFLFGLFQLICYFLHKYVLSVTTVLAQIHACRYAVPIIEMLLRAVHKTMFDYMKKVCTHTTNDWREGL